MARFRSGRPFFLVVLFVFTVAFGGVSALLGVCGPFTDVTDAGFCPFVLEIFTIGITTGTTPTTYDPTSSVSRLQMAAFLSRSVDGVLKRGSRRAVLNQFWTPKSSDPLLFDQSVGTNPQLVQSDGADIWVAARDSNLVSRVRGSDGRLLDTWNSATAASGILVLEGNILVTGRTAPGNLYAIPAGTLGGGAVTTLSTSLGSNPIGITYDGVRLFTANNGPPGSVSLVSLGFPYPVATVTTGFSSPTGALYDGANVWVTDSNLKKLDSNAAILQTVTVGSAPAFPVFDGSNIWVPNAGSNSVSVVRASSGAVLATLSGNGLSFPASAAFDGERILVTNPGGSSLSLWKAASLAPLGFVPMPIGATPFGACSDGLSFWVTLSGNGGLTRF